MKVKPRTKNLNVFRGKKMRKNREGRVFAATAVIPLRSSDKSWVRWVSKLRIVRQFWHLYERTVPFLVVAFSREGLGSKSGRQLIWGKMRRVTLSMVPPLARALQKKYGLSGGCANCGASCRLLFQCPHWDSRSRLCSVYEDRPMICKLFPITPADIRDRDLVLQSRGCGFTFENPKN